MYSVKVTTAVTQELVTVDDLKSYLRIDSTDEDTLLEALAAQCTRRMENYCGISIGSQVRVLTADLDTEEEELPYGPVISVDKVEYKVDDAYEDYTDNDRHITEGDTFEPFLSGRWKVEYTAGYTTLPDDLKLAILSEAAYRYENRGDGAQKFANEEPGLCPAAKVLANPYRRVLI